MKNITLLSFFLAFSLSTTAQERIKMTLDSTTQQQYEHLFGKAFIKHGVKKFRRRKETPINRSCMLFVECQPLGDSIKIVVEKGDCYEVYKKDIQGIVEKFMQGKNAADLNGVRHVAPYVLYAMGEKYTTNPINTQLWNKSIRSYSNKKYLIHQGVEIIIFNRAPIICTTISKIDSLQLPKPLPHLKRD